MSTTHHRLPPPAGAAGAGRRVAPQFAHCLLPKLTDHLDLLQVLLELANDWPIARIIWEHRKLRTLLGRWVQVVGAGCCA